MEVGGTGEGRRWVNRVNNWTGGDVVRNFIQLFE